jgi:hypothetical protein
MLKAINNSSIHLESIVLLALLVLYSLSSIAQPETDTTYLSEAHSKLIVQPQKYLLSPQIDIMTGASRVTKGDRSGVGYSVTTKGIYQIGNYFHFNVGLGYTRLNSKLKAPDATTTDSIHFANILHAPVGLSFILGDDRSQVITTVDFLPAYYLNTSHAAGGKRALTWGTSTEFGFLFRFRRHWYTGMTGKLQVFKSYDKAITSTWPIYGFAGVGIMVRFSY